MVNVQEDFALTGLRVGHYLEKKFDDIWPEGMLLTDSSGDAPYGPRETYSYGFVQGRGKRKSRFARFLSGTKLRPMVGGLWFDHHGASSSTHWIFHVYGVQHLEDFRELADDLATAFSVKVSIVLMSLEEEQEYEYVSTS